MSTANIKSKFHETGRSRPFGRLLPLLLALCLALALVPAPRAEAAYYDDAIQKLMGWGVLRGYPDGSLNPDSDITRAEFVALINRAYGYDETAPIPFSDVPADSWYRDDIAAAYAAGYFNGTSPTTASPDGNLTREQAMVLLSRNMRLDETGGEVTSFADGRSFQNYSAGYANTAVEKGLVSGYTDGSFRPRSSITRGEMAVMLARALGSLVNDSGDYSLGDVYGNVTVNTPDVTLRDTTIAGDLYLTGGLGLGGVTLENVRVLGDIIVAGGGESDAGESVILRNVTADSIKVDTLLDEYVSLRAEGDTSVTNARLRSDTYLQDRTASGLGFKNISLEDTAGTYTLSGNLENVTALAPDSTLRLSQGTVQNLTMDEGATGASLWLDANATVRNLNLDTAAAVTGTGDVSRLNVNVPGTSTEMMPDAITIRPGVTSSIAGTSLDSAAAAEVSSDPRLLAGYPRVTNIAATSATANFSTNKAGTVYWAVTAIMDGSVNAEALRSPATKASILSSGTVNAAASNTVYTAAVSRLTSGGSYYLSAMLVDARGTQSPVKVVSFSTPDDSVPAFGSGYPHMIEPVKASEDAWAVVMPTKDCQLYWVVYDAGSAAPTANSFRTGAFAGAYGSGVRDVTKNLSDTFQVNTRALGEQKSYDVYFWLNDADNAKSSAVRKLTFSTVDETPPRFNDYQVTSTTKDSIKTAFNLNEDCTVYWVAVPESGTGGAASYANGNYTGTDLATKIKISNGAGATTASGSVAAKANADAVVTLSRLAEATRYTIFFVARDAAGNYSDYWYSLTESTVDGTAPSILGVFFSNPLPLDDSHPYSDSSVEIIFSEKVQWYYYNTQGVPVGEPLLELYRETVAGTRTKAELANALSNTIALYHIPVTGRPERAAARTSDTQKDWTIDYRNATVEENENGTLSVKFPTIADDPDTPEDESLNSALNMLSGASYYFVIQNIADTYSTPNRMPTTRPEPDPFTTVDAEVYLSVPSRTVSKLYDVGGSAYTYGAGTGHQGEVLDADIVFDLLPSSIGKADPSQTWDLLIWSDGFLTFDMYVRVMDENGYLVDLETDGDGNFTGEIKKNSDGSVAMRRNGSSLVPSRNSSGNEIGWLPCPKTDVAIDLNATETGIAYKGASYQRHLLGKGTNPSIVNDEFNAAGLEDDLTYEFAIHVTTISPGRNANRTTWNADVEFWLTVDTGTSANFRTLCGDVNESGSNNSNSKMTSVLYNQMLNSANPDGTARIKEISSPKEFKLTIPFQDTVAPYLVNGYPSIVPAAETIDLSVQLNRAGTIFWVIAPADDGAGSPTIATIRKYASAYSYTADGATNTGAYEAGKNVFYGDNDVAVSGNAYVNGSTVTFTDGDNTYPDDDPYYSTRGWYPTYVTVPSLSNIYNPAYNNSRIASGSFSAENSTTIVTIPGDKKLTPDTDYFLYLVVRGSSAVYSEAVQVFQFHTTAIQRPHLTIDAERNISLTIGSNIKAVADYALVYYDDTLQPTLLRNKFYPQLTGTAKSDFEAKYNKSAGGETWTAASNWSVLQAMTQSDTDSSGSPTGDSVFDRYAPVSLKNSVATLIRGGSSATPGIFETIPDNDLNLTGVKDYSGYDLPDARYFAFVAIGHDAAAADASGDALGFRAYYPIYNLDTSAPKVTSVFCNLESTYDNGDYLVNGTIQLVFDQDLYTYYENITTGTTHLAVDAAPVDGVTRNDGFISVDTLRSPISSKNITIETSAGAANRNISTITLNVANAKNGDTIFLNYNQNMSSLYSAPVSDPLVLTLRLDTTALTGTVVLGSPGGTATIDTSNAWFGSTRVYGVPFELEDLTAPGIRFDQEALTLIKGAADGSQEADLTATIMAPGGAQIRDVSWSLSGNKVGSGSGINIVDLDEDSITDNGDGTYTIPLTAHSYGKATLTGSVRINGQPYTATADIYVTADGITLGSLSGTSFGPSISMNNGGGWTFFAYPDPSAGTSDLGYDLTWDVSGSCVSITQNNGSNVRIQATDAGAATITVYAGDPTADAEHCARASCTINVS